MQVFTQIHNNCSGNSTVKNFHSFYTNYGNINNISYTDNKNEMSAEL